MVRRNQAYKYKTPFQGSYEILQTWTNRNTTIQTGTVTARINVHRIKPYDSPQVELNTYKDSISILIYTTYNVTSIYPNI